MLKKTGLALLLLAATAAQAHAEYQCSVKPQDDVIISPQSVQVKGASGDLQISPDGDVIRNGQALSLNEMGVKQAANSGGNPLQAIMGNLGGLQKAIQNEWNNQEQDFQNFGRDVCNRVTALETQRKDLLKALK